MPGESAGKPSSFKESIIEYFNTTNISLIIGSSIVILGAFLNWVESPLVAVTGIGYELGYVTIAISIFILVLSYLNKYKSKRMILSFLSGLSILMLSLVAFVVILVESGIRVGGGLYLTLVGGLIIVIYSIKKYSEITTRKRSAILVGGTAFIILIGPAILVGGEVIYQYEKMQAEQDLEALEVELITAYNAEEIDGMYTAKVELNNPTDDYISTIISVSDEFPEFTRGETYEIPARSTKEIEIQVEDAQSTRDLGLPPGEEHAIKCRGGQYQGEMEDGTTRYYYKYECSPVPSVSLKPDHEAYDADNMPRGSFPPNPKNWH